MLTELVTSLGLVMSSMFAWTLVVLVSFFQMEEAEKLDKEVAGKPAGKNSTPLVPDCYQEILTEVAFRTAFPHSLVHDLRISSLWYHSVTTELSNAIIFSFSGLRCLEVSKRWRAVSKIRVRSIVHEQATREISRRTSRAGESRALIAMLLHVLRKLAQTHAKVTSQKAAHDCKI